MKKISVTALILAGLLLTGCRGTGTDLPETTAPPAGKVSTEDSLRPLYGLGSCQNFSGKLAAVTFYLDDSESSWDPEAIRAYNALFKEGYAYLEQAAGQWDTELTLEHHVFSSREGCSLRYPGGAVGSYEQAGESRDVLETVAACLGYADAAQMDAGLRQKYGVDGILCSVVLNKPGRSYTMVDQDRDAWELMEYSVFFTEFEGGIPVQAFVIAHETMHLFGAEDYYNPMGDRPNRYTMALREYPDDLMLRWACRSASHRSIRSSGYSRRAMV